MKSKILTLFTAAVLINQIYAQYYSLSFGLNLATQDRYKYPYQRTELKPMLGFNSQFGYDLHFWHVFYYSVQIGYDQVGIEFKQPTYNESFSYIQLMNFLKIKSSYVPFYFGAGGYGGLLVAASNADEDNISVLDRNNFKIYDYGLMPVLGFAMEYDFFMYFAELRLKIGLNNISTSTENYIKNRAASVYLGIAFIVH